MLQWSQEWKIKVLKKGRICDLYKAEVPVGAAMGKEEDKNLRNKNRDADGN